MSIEKRGDEQAAAESYEVDALYYKLRCIYTYEKELKDTSMIDRCKADV